MSLFYKCVQDGNCPIETIYNYNNLNELERFNRLFLLVSKYCVDNRKKAEDIYMGSTTQPYYSISVYHIEPFDYFRDYNTLIEMCKLSDDIHLLPPLLSECYLSIDFNVDMNN